MKINSHRWLRTALQRLQCIFIFVWKYSIKRRTGAAALTQGPCLFTFPLHVRRLFEGGAYSSKYGMLKRGHKQGVTKTKTLENQDLKDPSQFLRLYENLDALKSNPSKYEIKLKPKLRYNLSNYLLFDPFLAVLGVISQVTNYSLIFARNFSVNHNYNKIVKSNWLLTAQPEIMPSPYYPFMSLWTFF